MKTAKLGAMFLISVLALAGIGMGYAAWTDTITVTGEVNTGSVGWHFTADSGTWVYKQISTDGCIMETDSRLGSVVGEIVGDYLLVAVAYAEIDASDDNIATVSYQNIFPCDLVDWCWDADLTVEYTGTVPGRINSITFTDPWPVGDDEILLDGVTTITIEVTPVVGEPYFITLEEIHGLQLHDGDKVHVVMSICIPEEDEYEGIFGNFGVEVGIIQWNEYGI